MITVSILYPAKENAKFDFDYYLNTHMPMAIEKLAPALKGVSVEQGISGGAPGSPAPFFAACHFKFETVEEFISAFMPCAAELQGDIPNYTDVAPTIQISEVKIAQ